MERREDIVVSPLVRVMRDKLASPLLMEFGADWEVQQELNDLSQTLYRILFVLKFAEEKQIYCDLLKTPLAKFRNEAYHAHNMLDEFIYAALGDRNERNHTKKRKQVNFLSINLNEDQLLRRNQIPSVIGGIIKKLGEIEKEIKIETQYLNGLAERRQLDSIVERDHFGRKTSSIIHEPYVVGRTGDVDAIKDVLISDQYSNQSDISVVAIVGMPGLGKTTLAQLVYNDLGVKDHFDIRAWVYVSQDFNVQRLTDAIFESATKTASGLKELDPLQRVLEDRVRGKRVLLVLDDVWNEDRSKWNQLRVPFGVADKGSRIIVTTRSERVSSIMDPIKTPELKVLSDSDCWTLMEKRVFIGESSNAHSNLRHLGWEIVKKGKGLPLAVNVLIGLLCSKLDEDEWKAILESEIWELKDNTILPALSLSYHHLPAHLKQCFNYCALFPKGHEFNRKKIVRMWMAECFVRCKNVERMEAMGRIYFDELVDRSFFQYSMGKESRVRKRNFVMHELIHGLAQLVSSDICFRMDNEKPPCIFSKDAHHMSLITSDLDSIGSEVYKCTGLSTFVVIQCGFRCGQLHYDLFQYLRCLRVLDMSGIRIESLPDSIGILKYLRYLDLSGTDIRVLPKSICKLYSLQTLILEKCLQLRTLPTYTSDLINLQHLIVEEYLDSIPPQIGRLTNLKRLRHFCVGQEVNCGIGELKELQNLGGALYILKIENVVNISDAKEANLKNKTKLEDLEFRWSDGNVRDGDVEILEGLQPPTELKNLTVKYYGGSRFPEWMVDMSGYNKLNYVTLIDCKRCEFLPLLGQLPLLEYLHIEGMEEMKQVGNVFYGDNRKSFQKLKFLIFIRMPALEEWIGEEGAFPCLKKLRIAQCPRLRELPPLKSVKEAYIDSILALTAVPRLPSVSQLYISSCDERVLSLLNQCTLLSFLCISDLHDPAHLPRQIPQPQAEASETFDLSLLEGNELHHISHLKHLEIKNCPHLASFPKGIRHFTSLEHLRIEFCDKLVAFPEEEILPPKLKHLWIVGCSQLRSLPNGLRNLPCLEKVLIEKCNHLMSLPEDGLPISYVS